MHAQMSCSPACVGAHAERSAARQSSCCDGWVTRLAAMHRGERRRVVGAHQPRKARRVVAAGAAGCSVDRVRAAGVLMLPLASCSKNRSAAVAQLIDLELRRRWSPWWRPSQLARACCSATATAVGRWPSCCCHGSRTCKPVALAAVEPGGDQAKSVSTNFGSFGLPKAMWDQFWSQHPPGAFSGLGEYR